VRNDLSFRGSLILYSPQDFYWNYGLKKEILNESRWYFHNIYRSARHLTAIPNKEKKKMRVWVDVIATSLRSSRWQDHGASYVIQKTKNSTLQSLRDSPYALILGCRGSLVLYHHYSLTLYGITIWRVWVEVDVIATSLCSSRWQSRRAFCVKE